LLKVSDALSNANDQIARAAKIIGRSKDKAAVFRAVYHGKGLKTVEAVMRATKMSRKRVLEDAAKLSNQHLFTRRRENGEIVYERDIFIQANKFQILSLAGNPQKLRKFPTKSNPSGGAGASVTVRFPKTRVKVVHITIDEIDSFGRVSKVAPLTDKLTGMSEKAFKEGIKRVIGEKGSFTDWGGEKNDLLSTRLRYKSKRRRVAFAFKGPGKGGTLTPGKMGKNGDQIQRLFASGADFYLLQYWSQIDQSVAEQMGMLATAKSYLENREIVYGLIDGADSVRLVAAYPRAFSPRGARLSKAIPKKPKEPS
jgi:hypothetical protein